MQNRVNGPTESEFEVQNTESTTDGHLLTTGRPQKRIIVPQRSLSVIANG